MNILEYLKYFKKSFAEFLKSNRHIFIFLFISDVFMSQHLTNTSHLNKKYLII